MENLLPAASGLPNLHPAVVHFPISAWTAVMVTDLLSILLHGAPWPSVSFWLLVVGDVTAVGAMVAGFTDLLALPAGGRAQQRALRHLYVMSGAWTVFLIDLLVRPLGIPAWAEAAISVLGFLTLALGTHLGASLAGDPRYGGPRLVGEVRIPRVMLHAARLELPHPTTGAPVAFEAPPPEDFAAAAAALLPEDSGGVVGDRGESPR